MTVQNQLLPRDVISIFSAIESRIYSFSGTLEQLENELCHYKDTAIFLIDQNKRFILGNECYFIGAMIISGV